jgi:hypothetical protein
MLSEFPVNQFAGVAGKGQKHGKKFLYNRI